MKPVAYLLSACLGILGLLFVVGAQGMVSRLVVGVVLLAAGIALLVVARQAATKATLVQRVELSGDVHAEQLTCKSCGAALSDGSVSVKAGAVFVSCEHCNAAYQLEEEPKW